MRRLRARGLETELEIGADSELSEDDEQLVYRAAAEALRNVARHAGAERGGSGAHAQNGVLRFEVVGDDGAGFTSEERERRREQGHVGLTLLEELAARSGAASDVRSAPGAGTTFALELPRR